jgi:hypothetical protein
MQVLAGLLRWLFDKAASAMSDAAANLRDAIARCYAAFGGIPVPRALKASQYRDPDDVLRMLSSAPLPDLSGAQVGPYSGWAITTVGGEQDYRHFLPRILELATTDQTWLGTQPQVIASKLILAEWGNWPTDQRSAALRFFHTAFAVAIRKHPDDESAASDWLCALIALGEPPLPVLDRWRASDSPNAALQLASFIASAAEDIHRYREVRSPFWEDVGEEARRVVADWLISATTRSAVQAAMDTASEDDRSWLLEPALIALDRPV